MASTTLDYCILGAGIAGLSLADALQTQSFAIGVIEKTAIASGASGTPAGLVNPATGRKGKKTWKAEACYEAIRSNLEKVASTGGSTFYQSNGLLRPALTAKMARKMRAQFKKTDWPDGWCYWLNEAQIKQRHPGICCVDGGLWLPIGLTVDVSGYLRAYANYLQSKGVPVSVGSDIHCARKSDRWMIKTAGECVEAQHVVFATGYGTVHHPWWNFLPLEGVKGQVAEFETSHQLSFSHSISSMGYMARLDDPKRFVQGSTYEHDFNHHHPDEEGLAYLRSRMQKVLPKLAKNARLCRQWAGVRINTPNRKPVVGRHPTIKNLHVFTGLSSKGLLYGKFIARHYAQHLATDCPLFPAVSINRFDR